MRGLKTMLLGFAFLLIALMGAITYSDFGFILFAVGAPIGLILCLAGCFDEQLAAFFKAYTKDEENS